jgi:hypothetical protein
MHYVQIMHRSQPSNDLDEYGPDFSLWHLCRLLLVIANLLEEVSIVSVLHHYTEYFVVL